MKLKELESLLSDVRVFSNPKIELEQYPTSAHIASRVLYTAETVYQDIADRTVADLGCGGGVLSLAAAIMGAGHVLAVDVDPECLELTGDNMEEFDGDLPIDRLLCDVNALPLLYPRLRVDTVVTNPPFGTRRKGADMEFLAAAVAMAQRAVYSLNKSSTRDYIRKVAASLGCSSAEVVAELRYDLPKLYRFHKEKSKDIEVDLWRFGIPENGVKQRVGAGIRDPALAGEAEDAAASAGDAYGESRESSGVAGRGRSGGRGRGKGDPMARARHGPSAGRGKGAAPEGKDIDPSSEGSDGAGSRDSGGVSEGSA